MSGEGGYGPGFQNATSRLYKAEYVLFWGAFPELFTYIHMGRASGEKRWPTWGASINKLVHTLLLW